MSDSLPNQKLDDYVLETLLGRGGMASVYRGWDTRARRYVAIKVIEKSFREDSEYALRFEREAQAIGQLQHPNIVPLYRYGDAEGLLYMAMAYIEGSDLGVQLQHYNRDGEVMPLDDAIRVIRQICSALDYTHSRGVIHRDIKPSNVMLNKQGHAFLTDFGLALMTEIGTHGEIFGSPHYIAPEQAVSSAMVVPQSDLYSVGVILYEMFTGQLPFDAESPTDLAMMHMTEPPPPPREIQADLSAELEAVILKALAKEPEERYPDGAELADAVESALKGGALKRSSIGRQSIMERVNLEVEKNPLPPIPAVIASDPAQHEPVAVMPTEAPRPGATIPQKRPARPAAPTMPTLPERRKNLLEQNKWLWIYLAGGAALLLCAALVIGGFILGSGGDDDDEPESTSEQVAAAPTDQASPGVPTVPSIADSAQSGAVGEVTSTALVLPTEAPAQPTLEPVLPTNTSAPAPTEPEVLPMNTPVPPSTSTPAPTLTPVPPATAVPTQVAQAQPVPAQYTVRFVRGEKDSLFIKNVGGGELNPAPLKLQGEKLKFEGFDNVPLLLGDTECIVLLKDDKDNPDVPDEISCAVKIRIIGLKETFWNDSFDIYYDGQLRDTCPKEIEVQDDKGKNKKNKKEKVDSCDVTFTYP